MRNSKRNSATFFTILVLISGCQTSPKFKMSRTTREDLHIVEIETNRIQHECYFLNAEKENNWRHQYILSLLSDKNEVIQVFYPTNQGKTECLAHLKHVERVLRSEPRVRLCVRDKLEKMPEASPVPELHDFGQLGKHHSPYDALTFDTICNSKECFSMSDTWTYTCPDFQRK